MMAEEFLAKAGSDFVLCGISAGARHGLCSERPGILYVECSVGGFSESEIGYDETLVLQPTLYSDVEARIPATETTLAYTGVHQTILDMIYSGNDVSATDEALEQLEYDGMLEEVASYCLEHGLSKELFRFGFENYPELVERLISNV